MRAESRIHSGHEISNFFGNNKKSNRNAIKHTTWILMAPCETKLFHSRETPALRVPAKLSIGFWPLCPRNKSITLPTPAWLKNVATQQQRATFDHGLQTQCCYCILHFIICIVPKSSNSCHNYCSIKQSFSAAPYSLFNAYKTGDKENNFTFC
jgi:hypothetical protein